MHPQKILQKIPSSPAGPQWKKPHRILPLRKNVLARASSTLLPEPQPGSSSAVVCDSTRQIRAVTAALEGPGWWQGGRSGDFATPGPPAQHLASLQTGSSWLGGEFIPVEADVGREEVSKSSLEDRQKSVCLCGRSGDPTCHVARSGDGSQQCPARGFGSGHLDVRGEVCMPWVWHLQGFCSGRADLRKSPKCMSSLGLAAGRPACQKHLVMPVRWPQLTHLLSVAAEKVTSLGKDWHRPCLRCEKCNKTLTSGGHAEHDGKPYCNHPCYAALFGPKGFGRGGAESHTFK